MVTVANSGDEAAHSVAVVLEIQGIEVRGERRPLLEAGASFGERLEVALPGPGEGRWPYRLAVDYTDANQYPFQALSVATFERGAPPLSEVAVTSVGVPPLAGEGRATVRLKNLSDVERRANLRLVVPRGVEAPEGAAAVTLAPWEERSVELDLVNRFALAGSRYPLYAVLEYDEGSLHHSVVATAALEVIEATPVAGEGLPLAWIAAAVLAVVFGALLIRRLASR